MKKNISDTASSLFLRYVLYKLPKLYWVHDAPDYVQDGAGYAYLDDTDMEFKLSPKLINASESAAGRTLSQVYDAFKGRNKPDDQTHLFYDDANPEGMSLMRTLLYCMNKFL